MIEASGRDELEISLKNYQKRYEVIVEEESRDCQRKKNYQKRLQNHKNRPLHGNAKEFKKMVPNGPSCHLGSPFLPVSSVLR